MLYDEYSKSQCSIKPRSEVLIDVIWTHELEKQEQQIDDREADWKEASPAPIGVNRDIQ